MTAWTAAASGTRIVRVPRRVGAGGRTGVQQLVAEADDRAVEARGPLEHVDLAAADDRHRAGLDRERLAVDQVVPGAGGGPEQLVEVVPVRLPRVCDAVVLEALDLERLGAEGVDLKPGRAHAAARPRRSTSGGSRSPR
jgi:hypothetical protein